jgi:hypothetical protein
MAVITTSVGGQQNLSEINASANLDNYAIDNVYVFARASSPMVGGVSEIIAGVIADAHDGVRETAFSDLWYNRIHIIERHLNLGNLTANQTRTVEVWNAYFTNKTLDSYDNTGDIIVTGFASGVFNAIESKLYEVEVGIIGAPTIDAIITWHFLGIGDRTGTVTGQRVIPFVLRHNWAAPVLEQIAFKTDVLTAQSGKEQRIGLITDPRRRVEMSYLTLTALERAYLENALFGWQGRAYAVPLWADSTRTRAAVVEGGNVFDVDTVTRDFDIGGLLFVTDGTNYDTLEIADLDDDTITTVTGSLNAYSAGVKIVPARLAVLESKVDLSRLTNQIEDIRLPWMLLTDQVSTNRRVAYTPVTYRGIEVFNISNDYSDALSVAQNIAEDTVDNDTGILRKMSIGDQSPRRTYPFRELRTRADLGQFIEWIYQRKGKLNPFWFVERVPSFFLQADVLSTDTTFVVKTGGYTQFSFAYASRRDIAIRTTTGWKYRRITGAVVNPDGTETITLDSNLGVDLIAAQNPMMSFLKFVRLDQDMVELSYETNGIVKTATAFTDLLTNN